MRDMFEIFVTQIRAYFIINTSEETSFHHISLYTLYRKGVENRKFVNILFSFSKKCRLDIFQLGLHYHNLEVNHHRHGYTLE